MAIAESATQMPVRVGSPRGSFTARSEPSGASPRKPPPFPWPGCSSCSTSTCGGGSVVAIMPRFSFLTSLLPALRSFSGLLRRSLHQVVTGGTLHSVLIRIVVDNRMHATEVVERRRRRRGPPFQRSGLPGIRRCDRSLKAAVDQVIEKNQLRRSREQR